MRASSVWLILTCGVAVEPSLASTPESILAANRAASGGTAWEGKSTLAAQYNFSGQGLNGRVIATVDTRDGRFVQVLDAGPASNTDGFDGIHHWNKDNAGFVTFQEGADALPLAISEAYRNANQWWTPNLAGAAVQNGGEKRDARGRFDVLSFTPKGGSSFEAWFDAKSHLLVQIVERQGGVAVTTTFADYRSIEGAELPARTVVSTGNKQYDQVFVLQSAHFQKRERDDVFSAPKSNVADYSIAGGRAETAFPFRLINNHIYADVKINRRGPFTFIFDTGGVNLVTPALATSLGLKVVGKTEARGAGADTMQSGYTKVASLVLGDATIDNQTFICLPLDKLSPIEGVDEIGMIGYETFRRFVTRIDYGTKTITLVDPKSFNGRDSGRAVPIAFNGNAVILEGTYSDIPAKFQIDTGSRSGLTLDAPFVKQNGLHARYPAAIEGVAGWGVGGPTREYTVRGETLTIGTVSVAGPVTGLSEADAGAFADPTLAGNIGAGVLKQFVVTFDYGNRVMYLKRLPGQIADLNTFDRAGMWFNREQDGFRIVDVVKHAPADEAGLRKDDLVVMVDGKVATTIGLPDLRYRLRNDPSGTTVQLSVSRAGKKFNLTLTLRDLI